MTKIPEAMIKRVACVIAGNVTERQWDANPDMHGDHLEYALGALEAAGFGELIEALKPLAECEMPHQQLTEDQLDDWRLADFGGGTNLTPRDVLRARAALAKIGAAP